MRIVAVMSGKGGVGKTTTCLGTALALQELGFRPAILDLDLENPSMAGQDGATGLVRDNLEFPGELIQPPKWYGIPIMSLSLLPLPDFADTPTMIDEEQKHFLIRQLYKEVDWGDTELMVVDMPPGSGEEVRGLLQLELDGAVVVTSPQRISEAAVRKVLVMTEEYRIPIFGILENAINGIEGQAGERLSEHFGIPLVAQVDWSEDILASMENHVPFPCTAFLPIAQTLSLKLLQQAPVTEVQRDEVERALAAKAPAEAPADLAAEPWKAFGDMGDDAWAALEPLLPPRIQAGKPRLDDRAMLNGMLWVYTTRSNWPEMPPRYGKWETAKKRVHRWKQSEYWDAIWDKSKEFGYVLTEEEFDQFNREPDVHAGVLPTGNDSGEQARIGDEGAAEVPGSEPEERPVESVDALAGDS